MLFDLEAHEASIPVAPPVPKRQRQEPKQLVVPAQDWEEWSQIVCCAKMAEAKTGDIVSVPSVQHGGYLHCAFSALYGGMTSNYIVDAWQLVPSDLFEGEKWTYVDHTDYDESVRPRGDCTGLRLSVRGSEVICSRPVSVIRSLPTVRPMTLDEAKAHDEKERRYGWRAMRYKKSEPQWKLLNGHPVAIYSHPDEDGHAGVLLWKNKGRIHDYFLSSSTDLGSMPDALSSPKVMVGFQSASSSKEIDSLQAALF